MNTSKVNSFEEYRKLVHDKIILNNGYSETQTKRYICEGKLSIYVQGEILGIIYDEGAYFQLIIAKQRNASLKEFAITKAWDKPMVTYIVEDGNKEPQTELAQALKDNGMKIRCKSFEFLYTDFNAVTDYNILRVARPGQKESHELYEQMMLLWKKTLPVFEVPDISIEEWDRYLENGQMIYYTDSNNNELIGSCYFDYFLGTSTIHHICIDPKYRGKGYASKMLQEWLQKLGERKARRARAWIEEDNIASQRTFIKAGFYMAKAVSYQYIINK